MLKIKMMSIDFILWDWKDEKKSFFSEKKLFFKMRDARKKFAIILSDRIERARLFITLKIKFGDVLVFKEGYVYIQREMCDYSKKCARIRTLNEDNY